MSKHFKYKINREKTHLDILSDFKLRGCRSIEKIKKDIRFLEKSTEFMTRHELREKSPNYEDEFEEIQHYDYDGYKSPPKVPRYFSMSCQTSPKNYRNFSQTDLKIRRLDKLKPPSSFKYQKIDKISLLDDLRDRKRLTKIIENSFRHSIILSQAEKKTKKLPKLIKQPIIKSDKSEAIKTLSVISEHKPKKDRINEIFDKAIEDFGLPNYEDCPRKGTANILDKYINDFSDLS